MIECPHCGSINTVIVDVEDDGDDICDTFAECLDCGECHWTQSAEEEINDETTKS